jgi:AmmeMemoRadiSam system protein A
MSPLHNEEKRTLLEFARIAVSSFAIDNREFLPDLASLSSNLVAPGATFVTLHSRRRLRGCIGRIVAIEPLAHVVVKCAVAAASEDPRFAPLRAEEVNELEIEISVLSSFEMVRPEQVELGRHGLMISRGSFRGVLLPQVAAEYRWTRERFLQETCLKAGLPPDAWKDSETRIEIFTAEVFREADFRAETESNAKVEVKNPAGYSNSQ